ncbi:MAG: 50S ribosomal protein L21 [Syntrophobacterales bacterium]|nr:50S ribosomal protein L21 [Syntrophobacterales bacterium]
MYAVIEAGGKQHKVSEGELLKVEQIKGNKGDTVLFDNVLMISGQEDMKIGTPIVKGAQVTGEIVTQIKGPKISVFKMKRRKGYSRKTGHRQKLTILKIRNISM